MVVTCPMKPLTNMVRLGAVVLSILSSIELAYAVSVVVISVGILFGFWPQEPIDLLEVPQGSAANTGKNETILKASSAPGASLIDLPPQNFGDDFDDQNQTLLSEFKEFMVDNGLVMLFIVFMCVLSSLEMSLNLSLYKGATKGDMKRCKRWLQGSTVVFMINIVFITWDFFETLRHQDCLWDYFNARRIFRFLWLLVCFTTVFLVSWLIGQTKMNERVKMLKRRENVGIIPASGWDWDGPALIVNEEIGNEEGDSQNNGHLAGLINEAELAEFSNTGHHVTTTTTITNGHHVQTVTITSVA